MILQVFSNLGDSMIQFYRKYYCNKYRIALDRWRKRGFLCTCSLSLCSSVVQSKLECFSYISAVFHNNWSTDTILWNYRDSRSVSVHTSGGKFAFLWNNNNHKLDRVCMRAFSKMWDTKQEKENEGVFSHFGVVKNFVLANAVLLWHCFTSLDRVSTVFRDLW